MAKLRVLEKSPTGIQGLDEVTGGGLPKNRPTLLCGGPGSGKTLFGMEFLIHGALLYKEPGLFLAFEETEKELCVNVSSLGVDLDKMIQKHQITIDHVEVDQTQFETTGAYNLDGLFIRLDDMIRRYKVKRVVLDTVEVLFSYVPDQSILRYELQRLFRWFKEKKITAVITAEKGANTFSRYGLEEYVADCVILLDHRIIDQISTRRLHIIKYRGSFHGSNEYPFLINETGFMMMPITSIKLDYISPEDKVSSGIPRLDAMLGNKGFYRGSSVLVSGAAGAGKTSLSASFAEAICKRGGKCLYFSFEESPSQVIRNEKTMGINLEKWIKNNKLQFHAIRPVTAGLESHLTTIMDVVIKFKPEAVVLDPITNLKIIGSLAEVKLMLSRMVDFFKGLQITSYFTSLVREDSPYATQEGVSSMMDTWILLTYAEGEGERNRIIKVIKSRGIKHSNQERELIFDKKGIKLVDAYIGGGKVLTGSARVARENEVKIRAFKNKFKLKKAEKSRLLDEEKLRLKQLLLEQMQERIKIEYEESRMVDQKIKQLKKMEHAAVSQSKMADKAVEKKRNKNEK